jgi:hypothetical protein
MKTSGLSPSEGDARLRQRQATKIGGTAHPLCVATHQIERKPPKHAGTVPIPAEYLDTNSPVFVEGAIVQALEVIRANPVRAQTRMAAK